MDGITRIHELMEEFASAVKTVFPESTQASFSVGTDGYLSLSVVKMPEIIGQPVEKWPRKELWEQCRFYDGEWSEDRSADQNDYWRRNGILLEEG